jgi:DNA-binding transcriptional MocR family regulator
MRLPTIQHVERAGVIDLSWGHPLPAALPVPSWMAAGQSALRNFSWRALTYGYGAGPGPLVEWLVDWLGRTDAAAPQPAQVFVTAGASQGLELVSTVLTRPGDAVVVDSPTYHLALRILADRDVELFAAPADEHGIDPQRTGDLLRELRRQGRRIPLLYLVPTFGNPTGASLSDDRRRALVEVAARAATTIVEDDTYRDLAYDGSAPPSLWSIASGESVVRLGTFSKTVGPGLRLGWLTAGAPFVGELTRRGFIDSGGGLNHATALTMATFGASGHYAEHLATIRHLYRRHRDALVCALRAELPTVTFATPAGGWFVWLRLPDGVDATALLEAAQTRAVSFLTGNRCYAGPGGGHHLRLSFSFYEPPVLVEGVHRLGAALRGCAPGHGGHQDYHGVSLRDETG